MLDPQTAQERLKEFRVAGWMEREVARASGLRGEGRDVALTILGCDSAGRPYHDWNARAAATARSASSLAALAAEERRKVFETLFPRLAPHVEQAWELYLRLPYQVGMDRRAFRAPNHPTVLQRTRFEWLQHLVTAVQDYDQDVAWFAVWAPYLRWGVAHTLGILFAAAIEAGGAVGNTVFDILIASAQGEHEIGAMGRHVTTGLMVASRPDGWDFIERLFLAGQRQEGLRQVILETADEAHPALFRRILRLILEHDLARFAATVRAADVWFGLGWESGDARVVNETLQQALRFLDDPAAREQALVGDDAQALYLALWSIAFDDAVAAVKPAAALLSDPNVERRFVGAHVLGYLGLNKSQEALLAALEDDDLRVVVRALMGLQRYADRSLANTDLFERIERALPRFPRQKRELSPIVWPWLKLTAERQAAAGALLWSLGDRSPKRLLPHLSAMAPHARAAVVRLLAEAPARDAEIRDALFSLVGDSSRWVREQALKALAEHRVTAQEAIQLEGLLTRRSGDLRRGVLSILLNQKDEAALASVERLLGVTDLQQRLAGLDLLRQMVEAERASDRCRALAAQYRAQHPRATDAELQVLDVLLARPQEIATLENALGLLDPAQRTAPTPPRARYKRGFLSKPKSLVTPAAIACLSGLDALVQRHRTIPITVEMWEGAQREELLGNVRWGIPRPRPDVPPQEDAVRLPLREVWEEWWAERPRSMRDDDGLELLRALAALFARLPFPAQATGWLADVLPFLVGADDQVQVQYPYPVETILLWLMRLYPQAGAVNVLLDNVETTLALVPEVEIRRAPRGPHEIGWRGNRALLTWLHLARLHRAYHPDLWQDGHHVRLWGLLRWMDEPGLPVERYRPTLEDVLAAFHAGGASEADLFDHLLGPRPEIRYGRSQFHDLWQLSGRKPHPLVERYPALREIVRRCRERILEVEWERGEMPTAASAPALALRYTGGMEALVRLVRALGQENLVRGWIYDSLSKAAVFSHLIRATAPTESDTPEAFADQVRAARIPQKRLIEVAIYAPQWATFVEHTLEWPGFADAVWWIHAHTKDTAWRVDQEIREMWNAQISEYTPLSGQQLLDGAVDVAWFLRAYATLGAERWERLYKAARFASGGGGHTRAQLFADAMLGRVERAELLERIAQKRHKDAVRALGLLPLAEGQARDADLLERYRALQEFARTSRKFGAQRQASEKLAVEIGLANLARTSGYADPQRLEWAMEAHATADLVGSAQRITEGDVTIALALNRLGEPELTVEKKGKVLQSVPAALRKDPRVADLRERQRELKRQAARMRRSLEEAMIRGDRFSGAELRELLAHPVLAPMLEQLVFIGDGIIGYPAEKGTVLQFHDGRYDALGNQDVLRIAHPYDLFTTQEWHLWQRECYQRERVQPFKQVFRELYLLTEAERAEGLVSRRYAGQQVSTRQALVLLGQRGWVNYPEEGVRRTFHDENISAWVTFLQGFLTPADVEGLTLEFVHFTRRGDWKPLELVDVPPRLFSEVMRDLDLVVSVAHRGGVDPEASASTIEMRASLIRETCTMLQIANVRVEGRHALIEGSLGSYTVHLGSAVVHRQPGGAVCITPVHSQHRGRLFLPFVDDDPRTAEVISKVLLLARDTEIKDPTILEQILAKR